MVDLSMWFSYFVRYYPRTLKWMFMSMLVSGCANRDVVLSGDDIDIYLDRGKYSHVITHEFMKNNKWEGWWGDITLDRKVGICIAPDGQPVSLKAGQCIYWGSNIIPLDMVENQVSDCATLYLFGQDYRGGWWVPLFRIKKTRVDIHGAPVLIRTDIGEILRGRIDVLSEVNRRS